MGLPERVANYNAASDQRVKLGIMTVDEVRRLDKERFRFFTQTDGTLRIRRDDTITTINNSGGTLKVANWHSPQTRRSRFSRCCSSAGRWIGAKTGRAIAGAMREDR